MQNRILCLNARTGKEVWKKEIASFDAQYFSSNAPMILGNHVIVGTGNDMDSPGYIKSFDPETGALQWTFYTTPQNPGDGGQQGDQGSHQGGGHGNGNGGHEGNGNGGGGGGGHGGHGHGH